MKRVVFHVHEMKSWPTLFTYLEKAYEVTPDLKTVVVANGAAVRIAEREELLDQAKPWLDRGVTFELSKPSLEREGIDEDRVAQVGLEVALDGVAALINYQHDRYAYIRV
ncbi:DsrE family protein [Aerococcus sp. UMB1112A]|uniref:DsrE family protein n=1 Tax=unclassified Aerococcus TaxID=2618060 RepID=UPI00254D8979|nr:MULTISPECIES: DsrE family protein [unclassified Aerococcus]MDK6805634.1 DsrE family protein [Aerococcus sp. UMB7834]MDK8502783.1 DsrE family protein [Aerococcus sp. UMB1112A]